MLRRLFAVGAETRPLFNHLVNVFDKGLTIILEGRNRGIINFAVNVGTKSQGRTTGGHGRSSCRNYHEGDGRFIARSLGR